VGLESSTILSAKKGGSVLFCRQNADPGRVSLLAPSNDVNLITTGKLHLPLSLFLLLAGSHRTRQRRMLTLTRALCCSPPGGAVSNAHVQRVFELLRAEMDLRKHFIAYARSTVAK
jgi:hypothetical protein